MGFLCLRLLFMELLPWNTMAMTIVNIFVVLHSERIFTIPCNSFLFLVCVVLYMKQQILFVCVMLFNDIFVFRFHDTGYIILVRWFCIVLHVYFVALVIIRKALQTDI